MKVLITTDWYAPVINGVVTSVVNSVRFWLRKKSQRLLISQLFIPIIPFMRITRIIFLRIKNGAEKPYQNSLNGLQIHAAI